MILGVGTDIVEIARIQQSLERLGERFAKRILTESEFEKFHSLNDTRAVAYLAKRFAAKEAAVKALGTGIAKGVSFQHFCITNLPSGQPQLNVAPEISDRFSSELIWHVSLSDEQTFALAFVTLESKE